MQQQGWIKLHRKTLDNPVVCKDTEHMAVWMYLLLNATHREYPVLFGGKKIMLQPGQLITGRQSISEKLRISESKVQRILKSFEIEQQIEQQTGNKNRVVSILSWHEYQESEQQNEQQLNNKRTTTEQQLNTNKNVKNIENVRMKEEEHISQDQKPDLLSLFNKHEIQIKGVLQLEEAQSFVGVLDSPLIEHYAKLSAKKSARYFITIAKNSVSAGITHYDQLNLKTEEDDFMKGW